MKKLLAGLAFVGALSGGAAFATERTFNAVYNVQWRGVSAGEFKFQLKADTDSYEASAQRRASGWARSMVKDSQDYTYTSRGAVVNGALRPAAYQHQGGKRNRVVNVAFSAADAVTSANPAMGMGNPPATRDQRAGTMDQVSAIASMVVAQGDPCNRTIRVYMDGRSRFDFVMRPNGTQRVNSRAFQGEAVRCAVQFRPIAGFSDPQEAAGMTFLFAKQANGLQAPLRIEMPTDDGLIVLEAKSFQAG
jgi:hypothetical protein